MKGVYFEIIAQHVGGYVLHRRKTKSEVIAHNVALTASKRGYHVQVFRYAGDGSYRQVREYEAVVKDPW